MSTDALDLDRHSREVERYWSSRKTMTARAYDLVRGKMWTDAEHSSAKSRNKVLLRFNILKPQERTILGMFIQNKYDVKFSPREPDDDGMAMVYEQLRAWDSYTQRDDDNDVELVRRAWAGGSAYQECYMQVQPGKPARMCTNNISTFAVYWDPDSRELGERTDAKFVDVVSWMSPEDLAIAFPDKAEAIRVAALGQQGGSVSSGYSQAANGMQADRDHERLETRDGRYRVVERYYRVSRRVLDIYKEDGNAERLTTPEDIRGYQRMAGDTAVDSIQEVLYYAACCNSLTRSEYLYNGEYHCQPIDSTTGRVLFPVLEFVAEGIEGEPTGFVEQQEDSVRAVNAMMTHMLNAAKHAASQAKLVDKSAFKNDEEAERFKRDHSSADAGFDVKPGRLQDAEKMVDHSTVAPEVFRGMEYANQFSQEISSVNNAMKGLSGERTGGVLNAQQIEQAVIQMQVIVKNYRAFLRRRAQLRMAYWNVYYTYPMVVRVLDQDAKKVMGEFMQVNEPVPEQDGLGGYTGGVAFKNEIARSVPYDIVVEEGQKTSTYRARIQAQLSEMMASPVTQMDPVLASYMLMEYLRLSDIGPQMKEKLLEHSSVLEQFETQKQQAKIAQEQAAAQAAGQQNDNTARSAALDAATKQQSLEKGELTNAKIAAEVVAMLQGEGSKGANGTAQPSPEGGNGGVEALQPFAMGQASPTPNG